MILKWEEKDIYFGFLCNTDTQFKLVPITNVVWVCSWQLTPVSNLDLPSMTSYQELHKTAVRFPKNRNKVFSVEWSVLGNRIQMAWYCATFYFEWENFLGYSIPDTFAARAGETKISQQSMFWWAIAIATPNRALALERGSLFCSENTRGKEEE